MTMARAVKQDVPGRRDGHVTRALDEQQNEQENQGRDEHLILARAAAEHVYAPCLPVPAGARARKGQDRIQCRARASQPLGRLGAAVASLPWRSASTEKTEVRREGRREQDQAAAFVVVGHDQVVVATLALRAASCRSESCRLLQARERFGDGLGGRLADARRRATEEEVRRGGAGVHKE